MPRLFTAITLPDNIITTLQQVQPGVRPGLRVIAPEQIHLTLHFLGEFDLAQATLALSTVKWPAFELMISSLGSFQGHRDTILWAGLAPSTALTDLHQTMCKHLVEVGYQPEQRPYHPHITLARCDARVPAVVVEEFVSQAWEPVTLRVQEVVLFRSQLKPTGPVYVKELVLSGDSTVRQQPVPDN
jgi:2'-5' RNA ligase